MPDRHPDLVTFDRAVAEHEARQLADEIGYSFGVLTDGTIVLEPPADAGCCETCATSAGGDRCAGCGEPLDVLNRCQRVIQGEGLRFSLRFVCPKCYASESAG